MNIKFVSIKYITALIWYDRLFKKVFVELNGASKNSLAPWRGLSIFIKYIPQTQISMQQRTQYLHFVGLIYITKSVPKKLAVIVIFNVNNFPVYHKHFFYWQATAGICCFFTFHYKNPFAGFSSKKKNSRLSLLCFAWLITFTDKTIGMSTPTSGLTPFTNEELSLIR